MAKRGGFPGGMGGFPGGMNINKLMKEAKKMQADMEETQKEIASREFENSVGGGVISVKITGEGFEDTLRDLDTQAPRKSGGNTTVVNTAPNVGRNDPCPCGSGKKYKNCCGRNQ